MRKGLLLLPLAALALLGAAPRTAVAYFAGGCFWSNETDMDRVPGVISTTSGYAGGHVANPSYRQVSTGTTGHLETVRVVYDPARISYANLVNRFFHTMDPTDAGGQFCDRGAEYHTAVFVRTPGERRIALAVRARVAQALHARIATQVRAINGFYPAEEYHQDYARKNPVRYHIYRAGCGRDAGVRRLWSGHA
jgi:peptide-methionine (S)-S-oxide reductase